MKIELDYRIPSRLNLPKKLLFLSYDEAIPFILLFGLCFVILQAPLIGLCISVGWVFLIKYLKKGQGSDYLLVQLQKHLPFSVFKNIPKSSDSKWIF